MQWRTSVTDPTDSPFGGEQENEARTLDDLKGIRDKAEALRAYAKQAGEGLATQNACAEIKLRAERRAGELLAETVQQGGHNAKAKSRAATLPDTISRSQSSRWQQIATVPERDFETHVDQVKLAGSELTTAGVLRAQIVRTRLACSPLHKGLSRRGRKFSCHSNVSPTSEVLPLVTG